MEKKKKVLIVAGTLDMGGLENQLVYLARNRKHNEIKIDYTATKEDAYYKDDILNAKCGYIVVPDPRKEGLLKYCKSMYCVMKKGRYDVVHSQELFHSGIEMFLAWLARVPKRIAHSHSTQDGSAHNRIIKKVYHEIMRGFILLFATDYLACSTIAGKYLYGKHITKNPRFRVIFNSVDTREYFEPYRPSNKKIVRIPGWKYVIHVGRFAEVKNHKFMLEIAKEYKQARKKIGMIFVGDGELFAEIKQQVEQENLGEYVQMLGQRKDVDNLLREADAFVLPSHYEGMPLSVIEAQAAQVPCLIADHITEEVDFGLDLISRLALTDTPQKWAQELENLVIKRKIDADIVKRAIFEKGYDVSEFQKKLCKIYMEEKGK